MTGFLRLEVNHVFFRFHGLPSLSNRKCTSEKRGWLLVCQIPCAPFLPGRDGFRLLPGFTRGSFFRSRARGSARLGRGAPLFARFDFVQYSFFLSDLLAPLFLAFECDIFSCRSSRHLMHALYFASVYIIMAKAVLRLLRAAYRNEARYLV